MKFHDSYWGLRCHRALLSSIIIIRTHLTFCIPFPDYLLWLRRFGVRLSFHYLLVDPLLQIYHKITHFCELKSYSVKRKLIQQRCGSLSSTPDFSVFGPVAMAILWNVNQLIHHSHDVIILMSFFVRSLARTPVNQNGLACADWNSVALTSLHICPFSCLACVCTPEA